MVAKTYRVLAADDEYWICENLRRIIPWKDYGLEFLEPASDGEEVMERLQEERVDILITDINMPYVSGLTLLKKIKEEYPEIVTMVLSGYDDFDKVKGAFMEGSINYLLKPVNKSDLVNTLSRAIECLGERDAARSRQKEQQTQAQKIASFLQDNEFSRMLLSHSGERVPNIIMPGDLGAGDIDMVLLKFHDMESLHAEYKQDMLLSSFEIKRRIKGTLQRENLFIFNYSYRINEFILCAKMDLMSQRKIASELLRLFPEEKNGPLTVIIGAHSFSMENLNEAYQDAISIFMTRLFAAKSMILEKRGRESEEKNFVEVLAKEEEEEIVRLIAKKDEKSLKKYILYHIGIAQCEEKGWSLLRVRQTVRRIMSLIAGEYARCLCPDQSINCEALAQRADQEINQLAGAEVVNLFDEVFAMLATEKKEVFSDSVKDSIYRAIQYVDEHFLENFSLNTLAEKFHVEPTYFSRLFRQMTGDNLIPYVTKKRMERAAELMKKKELSLAEISFLVGYEDYGYFNRVFRKYKKCSPKDYRQQQEAAQR